MYFALGRHVSLAVVGERLVALDSRHDRYAAFSPARSLELIAAFGCLADAGSRSLIVSALRAGGFSLGVASDPSIEVVHVPPAERRLDREDRPEAVAWSERLLAAIDVARAARRLRYGAFERALLRFEDRGILPPSGPYMFDEPACARAVSGFEQSRNFVPIERRCLLDSLALRDTLWRHGVFAKLVIGVQLDPFSAHCWLQHGTVALNEDIEAIRRLTPIRCV